MRRNVSAFLKLGLFLSLTLSACDTAEQDKAAGPTLPPLSTEPVLPTAAETVVGGTSTAQARSTSGATTTASVTATMAATEAATATLEATGTAPATGSPEAAASPTTRVNAAALIDRGEDIYRNNCSFCHGPGGEGSGSTFPALAGSTMVTADDPAPVLQQGVHGGGGMPAFGPQLTDREVAAVVSYIRNAWGHDPSVVPPEQVEHLQAGAAE